MVVESGKTRCGVDGLDKRGHRLTSMYTDKTLGTKTVERPGVQLRDRRSPLLIEDPKRFGSRSPEELILWTLSPCESTTLCLTLYTFGTPPVLTRLPYSRDGKTGRLSLEPPKTGDGILTSKP